MIGPQIALIGLQHGKHSELFLAKIKTPNTFQRYKM
jgi:hypothetical protein